jgi:alcohol dehydrogenase (NADP+)
MCNQRNDSHHEHGSALLGRREVFRAGAALATAPLLAGVATAAQPPKNGAPVGNGPYSTPAYGAKGAKSPLGPLEIQRRAIGPNDVLLDVLYCGVCHSDIHSVRSDWAPAKYPVVPGHEMIGRVAAVGSKVIIQGGRYRRRRLHGQFLRRLRELPGRP